MKDEPSLWSAYILKNLDRKQSATSANLTMNVMVKLG